MMKRLLLIAIIALCTCTILNAQNFAKIDIALQQEMALRNSDELIRINIIMNEQYEQGELQAKASIFPTKAAKRTFVIEELKRFSKETQQGVMGVLDYLSNISAVSEVQSLWITNFIHCHATIEAIKELSYHPDILTVSFDKEYNMLFEQGTEDPCDPTREIAANISKVNAPQVWALGYEGEDVLVAVIDTGVNYDHNDLKTHMWEHPDFPYHGWNFISNNNNPKDDNGHGTHCAGTVAGDGTSGSQTGVAPKARIMAVKVLGSGGSGTLQAMLSGLQFALSNGADVVSMSLGFDGGGDASVRIPSRNAMVNLLNAGIVAAVSAGNQGSNQWSYPIPNNIGCPGNCPPPWLHPDQTTTGGTSAVICVGATTNNDGIAYFSSRGPVTWQTISGFNDYPYNPGMGLIRPDVCAPGENIKSLSYTNNSGYVQQGWSGTSMAAPCVAGTIALMLSKNPNLSPAEICEILETNAVKLPAPTSPKGNTFGSGRINALDAVLATHENIVVHEPQSLTASPVNASQIKLQWQKNEENNPVIALANTVEEFGKPQKGTEYNVGDQLPEGGEVIYLGDDDMFLHNELSPVTTYYYKIFSYNSEDYVYSKEGIEAQATTLCKEYEYPLFEDFEDGIALLCWEQEEVENNIPWLQGKGNGNENPADPYDGEYNIYFRWNGNISELNSVSRLLLPPMNLTGFNSAKLSFALFNEANGALSDELSVLYKTAENDDWVLWTKFKDNQNTWLMIDTLVLPELVKTESLQICFQGKINGGYGICIDNIYVEGYINPIGISDYGVDDNIKVYPNPTTGELRIENGELTINNVEMFDIYGRLLSTFNFQLSTEIDISHLSSGVYFVKISTEEGVFTKKIIKN